MKFYSSRKNRAGKRGAKKSTYVKNSRGGIRL